MPTVQTTAPAGLPVSRDDLKKHLRITSDAEDDYLDTVLATAYAEIDGPGLLGRAMISAGYTLTRGPASGRDVPLDIGPALTLTGIEYISTSGVLTSADLSDFELFSDGERDFVRGQWPAMTSRPDALRITYTAGLGANPQTVPAPLRHALTLLAAHRFEVRDEVVIGTVVSPVPYGVERLLDLYRVRIFG